MKRKPMEGISRDNWQAFQTIKRKIGRLDDEGNAKLYAVLDPKSEMVYGNKEVYERLPQNVKDWWNSEIVWHWYRGMSAVLEIMENLVSKGIVKVFADPEEETLDNPNRDRFQERKGNHPPDGIEPDRTEDEG